MTDCIRVLGMLVNARHGVREEERTLTQPFEVDVEVRRDLSAAARTDRLDDTIDYARIVRVVKEEMNGEHCRLLERLAGRILDRLEPIVGTGEIVVRIRKPRAPIDIPFRTMEVELTRSVGR